MSSHHRPRPVEGPSRASATRRPPPSEPESSRLKDLGGARLAWGALLLFGSGACALIYQVTWLRDLRLILGASTQATAAALAIFMGGLGAGGAWLGRRADRHSRPLRLYGRLELGVAVSAALTPMLLELARAAYVGLGGTTRLGPLAGSLVQLLLSAVVLGIPAVLMGGTLPAAARAMATAADCGRRRIALLYGVNALGAVGGALLATFVLLERLGARATVWTAAGFNLALALAALAVARSSKPQAPDLEIARARPEERPTPDGADPRAWVLGAAAAVGFAFLLMEMVWYRMLGSVLGGTTYAFGLILAMALLGIGLGGALYGWLPRKRPPTLAIFGATCALEALGLAIPYALGDRLAVLALLLRPLGQFGFAGLVVGWAAVTACVVLPAALVAGFQFPVLIALLGRGRTRAGTDSGAAYLWNTAGAIAGSLAGGFGLLPLLTAPGLWRLCAVLLAGLGVVAALAAWRRGQGWLRAAAVSCAAAAVLLVALPLGPTAVWRHSTIGSGRVELSALRSRNDLVDFLHSYRRALTWEADGRESSVGMLEQSGISLIVGGKSDGNTIDDAGTQIMMGLLGALLHPAPRHALVIGLGTGSTSGWLAQVPSIERVDTIELEPAVVHVARQCAAANRDVTENPRAPITIGDGREFLLTGRNLYDLIASEPSNPYRAGVAGLFTREYYQAAIRRLAPGGLFLQWVQTYEVDGPTLRMVHATLRSVFPHVETWATLHGDLALVASREPPKLEGPALRRRIAEEPFRSGLMAAWRTADLEGVFARFVGSDGLSRLLAESTPPNTDDRMVLEYRFARTLGGPSRVDTDDLWALAAANQQKIPEWSDLDLNPEKLIDERVLSFVAENEPPPLPPAESPYFPRIAAMRDFLAGDYGAARSRLTRHPARSSNLTELAMSGEILADAGDPKASEEVEALRPFRPAEADFILARLRLRQGDLRGATDRYVAACESFRRDPWTWPVIASRSLPMAVAIARTDRSGELGGRLFAALGTRFATAASNEERLSIRMQVAECLDRGTPGPYLREALQPLERGVPWRGSVLEARAACYRNLGDQRAARARMDLEDFAAHQDPGLPDPTSPTAP